MAYKINRLPFLRYLEFQISRHYYPCNFSCILFISCIEYVPDEPQMCTLANAIRKRCFGAPREKKDQYLFPAKSCGAWWIPRAVVFDVTLNIGIPRVNMLAMRCRGWNSWSDISFASGNRWLIVGLILLAEKTVGNSFGWKWSSK